MAYGWIEPWPSVERSRFQTDPWFDNERRAGPALLAQEDARRDERRRMGKLVRRLRPLLPRQARGRGHGRNSFHRYRLQAARRQDVPMHGLSAPPPACSRLRAAHGGRGAQSKLASRHLRLSIGGEGTGPARLASAGFGFARQRARGGRVGAGPGQGERERSCSGTLAGPDRQVAEPQAARPRLRRMALRALYAAARKRPEAKKSSFDGTPGGTKKYPPPTGLIYSSRRSPLSRDCTERKPAARSA